MNVKQLYEMFVEWDTETEIMITTITGKVVDKDSAFSISEKFSNKKVVSFSSRGVTAEF